ncbi:sensor histidine kinase [Ramlibacter albus]|uniref:histidine kinase n=1 Tax=Ramlibacter albus TaxID=2079448 RepID=A0A923M7C1_9BURK|nr:HAMP domain-containing sensor histidine kinase [Ramlibacter albus]MBC5765091.1 HAMP domain-containing histidine kinase [Ramlibacter albus]
MGEQGLRTALASFRRRILFRGVFLLLALATIALAIVLLQEEKERSYASYQQAFRRSQQDVIARLRQPAGMLVLLNPRMPREPVPVRPLVLPYPALDFEDPARVQQAIEAADCSVRYTDGSTLCAGVGNSAYAGTYLYLAGSFRAGDLQLRESGELDIEAVHRAVVRLELRGEIHSWVAPFERTSMRGEPLVRGRLLGFETTGDPTLANARPVRDFRGWLSQAATCASGGDVPDCPRQVFYAMRVPVEAFRSGASWPPADLDLMRVHVQMLAPGSGGPALFSSDAPGAEGPATAGDLAQALLPGEVLTLTRQDGPRSPIVVKGGESERERTSPLILRLIDQLPVAARVPTMQARETLVTPVGSYDVQLTADARGIDRNLGVIATRLSWYVGAMLVAILIAWGLIEIGLIRRITVLSRRAADVSRNVQQDARGGERIGALDVSDLRGPDELGVLAGGLSDLLQRVKDDVQREQLRAQQERDMLQAVGHEILSPLQSLMVLHPGNDDPAHRYVQRMQQAVKVLYGQSSPSEALAAAEIALSAIDLDAFLQQVAQNSRFAGVADVRYEPKGEPVTVRADEFSLEDVVTHILRNADRHRTPGTPITITLRTDDAQAFVAIHNEGATIPGDLLAKVFDYGVTEAPEGGARRGQGLFVARTYMAKMGGKVTARNEAGGVTFELVLPLSAG